MVRISIVLLATVVLVCGCNVPPVKRAEEVSRFREHLERQAGALRLGADEKLTMARCEAMALANSLELRVKELALKLQDERVKLALDSGLPKASLGYEESHRSNEAAVRFGEMTASFEDRDQQRLAVRAVAPALDFGTTYYSYKMAVDRRSQERLLLARSRQLLRRDVRVAYAMHAGAKRQEKLARLAYQAALQVQRVARSLERAEMTVGADTALVEASVAQAGLQVSLVSQRVEEAHLVLGQLMSLPPGVQFTIIEDLPPLPRAPTREEVVAMEETALMSRPELAVQDLERHVAGSAVRKELAAFFPQVDVVGSFNWSNASSVVNPSFFLYGFTVAHSLLDGGATLWRYEMAKKAATVEEERTVLASLGVLYEVQMRALRVRQTYETIGAAQMLEEARQKGLDRVVSLYKEGLEDEAGAARALADLTAQSTILDRTLTEYLVAWHELEAAVVGPTFENGAATQPATQPTTRAATRATTLPGGLPGITESR